MIKDRYKFRALLENETNLKYVFAFQTADEHRNELERRTKDEGLELSDDDITDEYNKKFYQALNDWDKDNKDKNPIIREIVLDYSQKIGLYADGKYVIKDGYKLISIDQCSGFIDKNNKLIYEKDWVSVPDTYLNDGKKYYRIKGRIVFENGMWLVEYMSGYTEDGTFTNFYETFPLFRFSDIEVIGNAHMNKDY